MRDTLKSMLKGSDVVFDKRAEDGMRFRIYQLGSLEVRTTQEVDGIEDIGAVLSVRGRKGCNDCLRKCDPGEKIIKAIQYVERAWGSPSLVKPRAKCNYFLVVETETGHMIVMEQLSDGTTTFEEDPEHLQDRTSLAKVIVSQESNEEVLVEKLQRYHASVHKPTSSASSGKRFVQHAFAYAMGAAFNDATTAAQTPSEKIKPVEKPLWWIAPPSKQRAENEIL